ncbi:sugar MFS transporter [Parachryseolinea silvisoli]|jgi:MFS transporter, FHS family, L-fucose permease|uniref:sugar MFS transporter n=1 Tax=Parachryseolinea silvisoli TaxID=2873601 RepID=UPI002265C285|nr:sugar MFS transporter [Parachryseolinea silvisoli]MCD9016873.1 sugar MFS transporter [Parachryseolinea silvisoli]
MTNERKGYLVPMIIIGTLFFIFGFVTWVNGTLIPYLKIACQLESDFQAYLVTTAFFIAYGVMGIPSSYVLNLTGYKKGMALGLLVMAVGAAIFIPAAQSRNYNLFLTGLFIIGTGLALLQTASNPYVTILGPIESAAQRISIMGVCNKVAGILAGIVFGYIALKDADQLTAALKVMDAAAKEAQLAELASRVIVPYIIITAVLVVLAVAVILSSLPEINEEDSEESNDASVPGKTSIFQFPHLFLGALALFVYVGVEVMAADTIISYGKYLNIEMSTARYFSQATLAFMLVGYITGIFTIPRILSQELAMKICAISGAIFTVLAVLTSGATSVLFIALLGLSNSLIWPAVWPLALDGLGKFTKQASGLLVMAIAGGAILPLIYGSLSDKLHNAQSAYWIMLPCYLYILYFGTKGYLVGRKK